MTGVQAGRKQSNKSLRVQFLKVFASLALCFGALFPALAQNGTVTGTVSDAEGNPLVGVFVTVQGTTTGTATDLDGVYSNKSH